MLGVVVKEGKDLRKMAKGENSSNPTNFFIIILPHTIQTGILKLPRKFVKEHGKCLSNHARLKLPTGAKSKMKLKRRNGQAWLHKGWPEFVEKYSIKCGYFLVFRYESRSRFSVQIFDLTTMEIQYPTTSHKKFGKPKVVKIKEEDCEEEDQNLSFTVIMQPAYVRAGYSYLHIPKGPARDFLREKGNKNIYLHLNGENGKVWSMKYVIGTPTFFPVRIYSGWAMFSGENNLQKGDVCFFELVNIKSMDFKVTISRKKEAETPTRERAEAFKSKNPNFKICITSSDIFRVPYSHARRFLKHGENVLIVHGSNGKTWPLKYCLQATKNSISKEALVLHGWRAFVLDNRLRVGDICIFEMIIGKAKAYKVTIFPVTDQE